MKAQKIVLLLLLSLAPIWAAGLLTPLHGGGSIKIKDHHVSVILNNGFAQTTVKQVFINKGKTDAEAIYTFPIPEKASLSSISIWINGKEHIGEVVEKAKASQIYNQQKQEGKKSALAEQKSHKTFRISVSPVLAGRETKIDLTYYQPLKIDQNVGRYLYPLADGQTDAVESSFWETDDEVLGTFSFECQLKSAFPIKDVRLPHFENEAKVSKTTTQYGDEYSITLAKSEGSSLNKDIVLYYRLDKSAPARVELIPYKEQGKEGTFMTVITPGVDLKPIQNGTDWTFVLDVSGSMAGGKLKTLSEGVQKSIGRMSPKDRFRVITFSDHAKDLFNGFVPLNGEEVQRALQTIENLQTEGGTNMYTGVSKSIKGLDKDRSNGVILVTDGEVNQGLIKHNDFIKLVRSVDVRIFTFVISNSANRPLLERIANESGGFAMTISEGDDIAGRIIQAKNRLIHQNIRDLKLSFSGEKVSHITPKMLPSLYAGEQLVSFGKYQKGGKITLTLSGVIEGKREEWHCTTVLPEVDGENPEIERLWALSAIEDKMISIRENGEQEERVSEVKKLGVDYSLVTEYTSMIVVEEAEKERYSIGNKNKNRVEKERKAQKQRAKKPIRNNRVDRRAPSFDLPSFDLGGSGPVGPVFVFLSALIRLLKKRFGKKELDTVDEQ